MEGGKELLHYRLVDKIGEGGMGVVWRAVDTSLDREVAIKVLPEALTGEAERMARFDREAKLLASLEHPNIASVYGLHEAAGVRFLAMEYVKGEDVSQRLARGPLPVAEALAVARQVAEALEGAHASGIIHRDLKPANIMLTPDGKAKVLDFGLAKAFETDASSSGSPSMSPTLTSAGTVAGMILGTAAYMSPEQARGYTADKRSDIWALGCVLFEMLTEGQLHRGDTISDTLASVLTRDPDWEKLPTDLPAGIRRLLRRCLQKDPRLRLHDAADARIEIDEALAAPDVDVPVTGQPVATPRTSRWLSMMMTAAALAAAVALGWSLKPGPAEPPTRRFVITSPDPTRDLRMPIISPDGRRIAYVVGGKLAIRELDQVAARTVVDVEGARSPFWSPDSTHVACFSDDKLWKLPVDGGQATRICDIESVDMGVWGEDDTIVLMASREIHRVSARGGDVETIAEIDRSGFIDFHGIDLLPGGGMIVGVHHADGDEGLEVWIGDERRSILRLSDAGVGGPRWAAPGFILYTRRQTNEGIWALPFDPTAGRPTGDPFLVDAAGAALSVSRDGTMVHVALGASGESRLVWVTSDGEVGPTIGQPQERMFLPSLSPDGTRVAVTGVESGSGDIWIHDVARGTKTRLTFQDEPEGQPTWSPDGKEIYFFHPVFGADPKIYSIPADGRGEPRALTAGRRFSLSPKGEYMVLEIEADETKVDLWTWRVDGSAEPEVFLQTAADEIDPQFSPDGRFVAYQSDESGRDEIYVKPHPSGEGKWQVSIDGGIQPRWSRDGKRLYYTSEGAMYRVAVETETGLRLSTPVELFEGEEERLRVSWGGFDVVPDGDGERFVLVQRVGTAAEGEETEVRGIFVVENWSGGFEE